MWSTSRTASNKNLHKRLSTLLNYDYIPSYNLRNILQLVEFMYSERPILVIKRSLPYFLCSSTCRVESCLDHDFVGGPCQLGKRDLAKGCRISSGFLGESSHDASQKSVGCSMRRRLSQAVYDFETGSKNWWNGKQPPETLRQTSEMEDTRKRSVRERFGRDS